MSKIIDLYNDLKKSDNSKIYAFKIGSFFNFYDEDAKLVSELLNLKITAFTSKSVKCGFPINSKENKFEILDKNNINYEIVEPETEHREKKIKIKVNISEEIVEEIRNIDLMNLSEKEAFIKICGWQAKLK